MLLSQFGSAINKAIGAEIDDAERKLLDGGCADFVSYMGEVKRRKALIKAQEIVIETIKKGDIE
jgi:hypothetical protein